MQTNLSNMAVGPHKTNQAELTKKYDKAYKADLHQYISQKFVNLESRDSFFKEHAALKNIIAQLTNDTNQNEDYRKDLTFLLANGYDANEQLNVTQIGANEVAELTEFIKCADEEILKLLKQEESTNCGFTLTRPNDLKQQKEQFINSNSTDKTNNLFYFSHPKDAVINLNCIINDDAKKQIKCRQLAFAYIVEENILNKERRQGIQQPKRQGLVRSAEDLEQANGYLHKPVFIALRQNRYDRQHCYLHADKTIGLPLHKFGKALAEVAKDNLTQPVYMILHSQNHAMAIIMKPAKLAGYFSIKFFDPNRTNTHIRSLFKANKKAEEIYTNLQELKLTNYLSTEKLKHYFRAITSDNGAFGASLSIFLNPRYKDTEFKLVPQTSLQYQSLFDNVIDTTKEELYSICAYTNNPEATALQEKLEQLLNSNKSEEYKLNTLLFAPKHSYASSVTLNYNFDHHHTAKVYTAAILASNLSIKAKILALKGSMDDKNGLSFAFLKGGYNKLIHDTLRQILDSNLPTIAKLAFFQEGNEWPLFMSISSHETLIVYLRSILESTNSEEDKLALVSLKNKKGQTVISHLFSSNGIINYLTTIINSGLTNPSKASLLSQAATEMLMRQPLSSQLVELLPSYIQTIANSNLPLELKSTIFSNTKQRLSSAGPQAKQYLEDIDKQLEAAATDDFFTQEYAKSLN